MRPAVLVTPMADSILRIKDAVYVGVDAGALLLLDAGIMPDYVVGDFDTVPEEQMSRLEALPNFDRHPVMKDESDTELALALVKDCSPKFLCGAFGGRLDHTLANLALQIGQYPDMILLGDGQFAQVFEKGDHEIERVHDHISFFPLEPSCISLKGLLYELDRRWIRPGEDCSLTLSNSFVKKKKPSISVHEGRVLCIQSEKP